MYLRAYLSIYLSITFVSHSLAFSLCHHDLYAKSYSKHQYRL